MVSPGGMLPDALTVVVPCTAGQARYCSSSGSRFSSRSAGTKVNVCPAMGVPLSGGNRSRTMTQQNL